MLGAQPKEGPGPEGRIREGRRNEPRLQASLASPSSPPPAPLPPAPSPSPLCRAGWPGPFVNSLMLRLGRQGGGSWWSLEEAWIELLVSQSPASEAYHHVSTPRLLPFPFFPLLHPLSACPCCPSAPAAPLSSSPQETGALLAPSHATQALGPAHYASPPACCKPPFQGDWIKACFNHPHILCPAREEAPNAASSQIMAMCLQKKGEPK